MSEETSAKSNETESIMDMIWPGLLTIPAIYSAAKLNIAELVDAEPRTLDELVEATGADASSLCRLLRWLASNGIFKEEKSGRFSNTPLSNTLRGNDPQSVKAWALFLPAPFIALPCMDMFQSIVTGKPAFDRIYGKNYFHYLAENPDDAELFNAAMTSHSEADLGPVLEAYDFSRFKFIIDVGGGHGAFLSGVLAANPGTRGLLFDLPAVIAGADQLMRGPAADQAETLGGDFFESVPEGGDAYIVKGVIGDWDDERAISILKNCRKAMRPDSLLLIVGGLATRANDGDLLMLVLLGGGSRSEAEYRDLLPKAGFAVERVVQTKGSQVIIEARPV